MSGSRLGYPPGSGHPPFVPPEPGSEWEGPAHSVRRFRNLRGGDTVVSGGNSGVQPATTAAQGLGVGGGCLEGVAFRQSLYRVW